MFHIFNTVEVIINQTIIFKGIFEHMQAKHVIVIRLQKREKEILKLARMFELDKQKEIFLLRFV